jgi:hypothetical protein
VKAVYAVGYFTEVGIGTPANIPECVLPLRPLLVIMVLIIRVPFSRAISYYKRAADLGDRRAAQRLKGSPLPGGPGSVVHRDGDGYVGMGKGKDKDCVIM